LFGAGARPVHPIRIGVIDYYFNVPLAYYIGGIMTRAAAVSGGFSISYDAIICKLFTSIGQLTGSADISIAVISLSAASWMLALVLATYKRVPKVWRDFTILTIAALPVFGWYAIFKNHTFVHAWFMVRLLAAPIGLGFMAPLLTLRENMARRMVSAS
jgi:hypothetical protein